MMDLIDKQAAIDAVHYEWDLCLNFDGSGTEIANDTEKALCDVPSTDVQPVRHGRWIDTETSYADGVQQKCQCSVCKRLSPRPLGNFCRWCGTDMRGDT